MLTSFGRTIDANLFLEQDRAKLFVVFHLYSNGARTFPGLDVQAIDCPVTIFGRSVQLSLRGAIWIQPSGQRCRTERGSIGGLIGAKLHRTLDGRYGGYLEVEAKTAGWVAGNVFLGRKVSLRAGASIAVP